MLEKTEKLDGNGTVGKALFLLDVVGGFDAPVRFNDILAKSPYPKPSTYRLLQTLVSQQMLGFDPSSERYTLGSRLIRLAHSAWRYASLVPIATGYIDALSEKTGETIHLAKLDNGQVLYLNKRNASRPISMFSDVGKISPAYCTGVGKAMLAFLKEAERERTIAQQSFFLYTKHTHQNAQSLRLELETIRTEGVAFDREEHEPSIICIAVPILTPNEQIIGGMSITSSTMRTTIQGMQKYKNDLQQTARQVGEDAAAWMLPQMGV